jgi:hypothetical protein
MLSISMKVKTSSFSIHLNLSSTIKMHFPNHRSPAPKLSGLVIRQMEQLVNVPLVGALRLFIEQP